MSSNRTVPGQLFGLKFDLPLLGGEYGQLEHADQQDRRKALNDLLDAIGVKMPVDRMAAHLGAFSHKVGIGFVEAFLDTHAGAKLALDLSVSKIESEFERRLTAAPAVAALDFPTAITLARIVAGFDPIPVVRAEEPDTKPDAPEAKPDAPAPVTADAEPALVAQ